MPAGASYWIKEDMLSDKLYNADTDHDGRIDHIYFTVKDKFLHPNHPLGWVRKITVLIDGKPVDQEDICFVIRGQWIPLKYMPTIRDIWWHMREDAALYIKSEGLIPNEIHTVDCDLFISLMVHTQNLDSTDIFSCLHCSLTSNMTVQEEVRQ